MMGEKRRDSQSRPTHYSPSPTPYPKGSSNEYAFDVAFDADASQSEVYEHTAKLHVPSVLDGFNVSILAYGATGAGT